MPSFMASTEEAERMNASYGSNQLLEGWLPHTLPGYSGTRKSD